MAVEQCEHFPMLITYAREEILGVNDFIDVLKRSGLAAEPPSPRVA